MKKLFAAVLFFLLVFGVYDMTNAQKFVAANNPFIQYFGRWDLSDSIHARHSWPGVYLTAEFTGKKIGVRMNDGINYYNVYIDGNLKQVLHASKQGEADYILADNLSAGRHTLRLSKRNICFDKIFSISGLILDSDAEIIQPAEKPKIKIEFIGDSFTAAESNEAKAQSLQWEERYPVTNFDLGFAGDIARHFNAQYIAPCRSGSGVVCDWQGKREFSIPYMYDRTLMEASEPKWDFSKWTPDLVISTLGLNDMSGLKEKDGSYTETNTILFRNSYKDFIQRIKKNYPNVKILLVAAHPEWIQKNVNQIVDEEKESGNNEIYFSKFDYFDGGYVANGHPTIETDKKIADIIIKSIEDNSLLEK